MKKPESSSLPPVSGFLLGATLAGAGPLLLRSHGGLLASGKADTLGTYFEVVGCIVAQPRGRGKCAGPDPTLQDLTQPCITWGAQTWVLGKG